MIDPRDLADLDPDAQRLAVVRDLAEACERALAVLTPDDPLVPGLVRASAGFQHLAGPPRPHLRGLPTVAGAIRSAAPRAPLLHLVPHRAQPGRPPGG